MRRKIYDRLLGWKAKEADKCALMIEGARRVGKSYIALEFARNEYKSHLLIDFNNISPQIIELFENNLSDLDVFFRNLRLLTGVKLYPRESVIIFDEVQ